MALLRSDIINNEFILAAIRNVEKTSATLESITSGLTIPGALHEVVKLQVSALVRGREKNYTWIAKLAPSSESTGSVGLVLGLWQKEIQVYRELFPSFDFVCHGTELLLSVRQELVYSSLDLNKECLLFSDICSLGFQPSLFPLTQETVFLAVEWLARFHALGFSYANSNNDTQWLVDTVPYAGKSSAILLELAKTRDTTDSTVLTEYASRLESLFSSSAYADICRTAFSPRKKLFSTICHGRPTVNSLLEWRDGNKPEEAIFVDFSQTRLCQPATDLAILLYTSTGRTFRKDNLSSVLKRYHGELSDSLLQLGFPVSTYSFSQLVDDYQDAVVPAVGVAVNLIPGLIGTGDETDSVGAGSGDTLLCDFFEELEEMKKI